MIDKNYRNVICVKNNNMTHYYFTNYKKKIVYETKKLDIETYIKDKIKETSLIHGVAPILKNLKLENVKTMNIVN